ncbi:HAD family hydrolase [Allosphingosinicella sp.]|uniref:HAD family hydrolase n=1 Tax=Allosphingosinicella sp. TaxID=2823234 RepID=UPI002EF13334
MSRPLLISDCDEVLLHMVVHFAEWIEEAHGYRFELESESFRDAIRDTATGEVVAPEKVWPLLDGFFDKQMHRQNLVPGAIEALAAIGEHADIVILTNLGDQHEAARIEQLARFEIRHRVLCNRGGKGAPVAELVAELGPSVAVFVDDLAVHHQSVAELAPQVWRLQMIAEPKVARHMPAAPHAHARIDHWGEAVDWIVARFHEGPAH